MAVMLKPLMEWAKLEVHAGAAFLQWFVKDMWWAAVLAAVLAAVGFEGGTGGMWGLVQVMWMIRIMKLPLEMWRWVQTDLYDCLGGCLEKLSYMERRLMKDNYGTGDICRILGQDMEGYNEVCGNRRWLQRRMRDHFEAWMKVGSGLGDTTKKGFLKSLWSMVCSEVQLRFCRDIVGARAHAVENGVQRKPEKVAKEMKTLENLKVTWCDFWQPLQDKQWTEMETSEASHFLEMCLQSQLCERKEELHEYAGKALTEKDMKALFEGMPDLVKCWVEKAGSSDSLHEDSKNK